MDEDQRLEPARLDRWFRHIGSGADPLRHSLTEHIRSQGKGLGCSFGHRAGITVDEDHRPERAQLERRYRHIGSGNDRSITR